MVVLDGNYDDRIPCMSGCSYCTNSVIECNNTSRSTITIDYTTCTCTFVCICIHCCCVFVYRFLMKNEEKTKKHIL